MNSERYWIIGKNRGLDTVKEMITKSGRAIILPKVHGSPLVTSPNVRCCKM